MVKTAIAGAFRRNDMTKNKSSEKAIKKAAAVLIVPLTAPLKNKSMGSRKRKGKPITGIKTAAKTNEQTPSKSFKKGLSSMGILKFFKDGNLLKI
jgi:hypothetical protein